MPPKKKSRERKLRGEIQKETEHQRKIREFQARLKDASKRMKKLYGEIEEEEIFADTPYLIPNSNRTVPSRCFNPLGSNNTETWHPTPGHILFLLYFNEPDPVVICTSIESLTQSWENNYTTLYKCSSNIHMAPGTSFVLSPTDNINTCIGGSNCNAIDNPGTCVITDREGTTNPCIWYTGGSDLPYDVNIYTEYIQFSYPDQDRILKGYLPHWQFEEIIRLSNTTDCNQNIYLIFC